MSDRDFKRRLDKLTAKINKHYKIQLPGIVHQINCRCTLVNIQEEPKQLDLFGEFVPATLGFQDMIKELQK